MPKYKVLVPICAEFKQEAEDPKEAAKLVVENIDRASNLFPWSVAWRGGLMLGFPYRVSHVKDPGEDLVEVDVAMGEACVPCEVFEED